MLQDICDAIWTEATRELRDDSPLTPATLLEEICDECWTEAGRKLTAVTASPQMFMVF